MKRFLLFAGEIYYAYGGWNDFVDSFDNCDHAIAQGHKIVTRPDENWWHVVDTVSGEIVGISEYQAHGTGR